LLIGFGGVMKYPSKFQKICYGTQCIFKIPYKGYCKLSSFGHEQYPSNNVDPCTHSWCLIIRYFNEGIGFLVGFGVVMQYLPSFKIYVIEPKGFMGYLTRGITWALNIPLS
jgi:hypothetical protein